MDDKINVKEIDLHDIDWTKLEPEDYQKLENSLQENQKLLRKSKPKEKRASGYVTVIIRGNTYSIKEILYKRLKTLKSGKSKEKLIDEIISTHNVIDSL
ncbi:hypothetical protein M0Q97_11375 [Candidatus Dojkabacteria bacterium]|jgi:DNA-binding protein YbaB|nr:hypothetical protein [Candidatus Dojkabacteria bacterium]